VVADEVRALSSRTHAATEQIQTSVKEIQSTLNHWSNAMQKGKESAEACVNDAEEAHNLVSQLVSTLATIADLSTQISTAAEEQSAVSAEISKNIVNISDASEHNRTQAQLVDDESRVLTTQVDKMRGLSQSFNS
jgi:aerotaxis receptor